MQQPNQTPSPESRPRPQSPWGDPRLFQIAILSSLLAYGLWGLDLEVRPGLVLGMLATALAVQGLFTYLFRLPRFDPKSALISGLSLGLMLRTDSLALGCLAAVIAISSKFLIRHRGKHVFNPTNLALVSLLLVSERVWVSPGQWGSVALFGFLLAGLGSLVVRRAARSDVTWALLLAYSSLIFGRALWLGDPLAIALHQLSNGAFLIFAFFMISDPKTTPDSRPGRILFAILVAWVAGYIQFTLYQPNALIWALALCAPLVPLSDRLLGSEPYRWTKWRQHRGGKAPPSSLPQLPESKFLPIHPERS
jgi:Na+-transporting NADH:ubiquinone oxidoreductase subunit NqrB